MIFNINFNVEFICDKFDKENNAERNIVLNLPVNEQDASNFLFKFTSPVFRFGEYKVLMKYDSNFIIKNIVIFNEEFSYIVKNPNIVLSTILEGYIRIKTMNKIGDIMEYQPPIDEEIDDEDPNNADAENNTSPYDDPNYDY